MNRNKNTALIIGGVIVAIVVFLILGVLLVWGFQGSGYGMMGPEMMRGYGSMFLVPIIIIGLIVWAVVTAAQKSSGSNDATSYKAETPLDTLKRRYAQGEIDKEEYEAIKRDLT